MATKPTPGASDGTWGTEMNTFLDVSLDVDGKIATEALQTDATAPSADAAVANKKYVDDQNAAQMTPTSESDAAGSNGVTVFANGFRIARGTESVISGAEDIISPSGFTVVYRATVTVREDNNTDEFAPKIGNYSGATFTIRNTSSSTLDFDWIAIGR